MRDKSTVIVLFGMLLAFLLQGCEKRFDSVSDSPRREAIVNGTPTGYDAWQSAVLVDAGFLLCTGTLIHPRVVLTAGHCIFSEDLGNDLRGRPERIAIMGGDTGEIYLAGVAEIIVHPNWTGKTSDENDLALLRLSTSVTRVAPAVVRDYPSPAVGDAAVIVGYGVDPFDTVHDGTTHRMGNTTLLHISPYFIEIGGETNTCTGDSGGPLFTQQGGGWALTGVTSYGADDCTVEKDGFSVNLLSYCGWLNDTMDALVGEDLGLENCIGCDAAPAATWGQPCGPGYPCCPEGTACRTPENFSTGTLGYCAPTCCNLGKEDVGYCTNVTTGTESCLFTADFESAYCAISCDNDDDCMTGTVCKNRPFASDRICIAEVAGDGPDCSENGETDTEDALDTASEAGRDSESDSGVKSSSHKGSDGCRMTPSRTAASAIFRVIAALLG